MFPDAATFYWADILFAVVTMSCLFVLMVIFICVFLGHYFPQLWGHSIRDSDSFTVPDNGDEIDPTLTIEGRSDLNETVDDPDDDVIVVTVEQEPNASPA